MEIAKGGGVRYRGPLGGAGRVEKSFSASRVGSEKEVKQKSLQGREVNASGLGLGLMVDFGRHFRNYFGCNKRSLYVGVLMASNVAIGASLIALDRCFSGYVREFASEESTGSSRRDALFWYVGTVAVNAGLYAANALVNRLLRSWLMIDYREDLNKRWKDYMEVGAANEGGERRITVSDVMTNQIENGVYYWVTLGNDLMLNAVLSVTAAYQLYHYSAIFMFMGIPVPTLLVAVVGYAVLYKLFSVIPNRYLNQLIQDKKEELAGMRNDFDEVQFKAKSMGFESDKALIEARFRKHQTLFSKTDSQKLLPQYVLAFTRSMHSELCLVVGSALIPTELIMNFARMTRHLKQLVSMLTWSELKASDLGRMAYALEELKRMEAELDRLASVTMPERKIGKLLQLKGSLFPGESSIAVDLEVSPGNRIKLAGLNGVGKSTLMRVIVGKEPRFEGSITIPEKMVYLPQKPLIWDNVSLRRLMNHGRNQSDGRLKEYMRKLGLGDLVGRLDDSVDWSKELSGGQKQLVVFAKLLMLNEKPEIILMDEPFSALSKEIVPGVWKLLYENFPNTGMLIIDHGNVQDEAFTQVVTLTKPVKL